MAKLSMPLCSYSASGTISHFLTFSNRNSGSQVRWQKKQKDNESANRLEQRRKFLSASLACRFYYLGVIIAGNGICGLEIEDVNLEAEKLPMSGYNLGIKKVIDYF